MLNGVFNTVNKDADKFFWGVDNKTGAVAGMQPAPSSLSHDQKEHGKPHGDENDSLLGSLFAESVLGLTVCPGLSEMLEAETGLDIDVMQAAEMADMYWMDRYPQHIQHKGPKPDFKLGQVDMLTEQFNVPAPGAKNTFIPAWSTYQVHHTAHTSPSFH